MDEAKSRIPENISCHQLSSGEQEVVESYGGRIVFTDEITFSSSELINTHIAIHEPERPGEPDCT